MRDKIKPHTEKNSFYPKPVSFSNKFLYDVGNILTTFQRESDKTIKESDFELQCPQHVKFYIKKTTPQM